MGIAKKDTPSAAFGGTSLNEGGRVSPAGSVGSRQSATGARSPLSEGGVTPPRDRGSCPPKLPITKKVHYFLLVSASRGFQRGMVSASASVGDGRSPLATIAPL